MADLQSLHLDVFVIIGGEGGGGRGVRWKYFWGYSYAIKVVLFKPNQFPQSCFQYDKECN